MPHFPSLATHQYTLRRLNNDDAPPVYILRTDENVNRYLDRPKPSSPDDVLAFIQKINKSVDNNESFYWVICKHDDASLMGTICLFNFDIQRSTAEVGYELLPAFQGMGIFQEVMPAVISFAFENTGVKTIEAYVAPGNISSIRLLEKHGFAQGDVMKDGQLAFRKTKPS